MADPVRESNLGTRALGMMQFLMAQWANRVEPQSVEPRGVVQADDVAHAVLQIAAAVDEWLQSDVVPVDRALHVMTMLMIVRDYAMPLPRGGPEGEPDPVTADLEELVTLLRQIHERYRAEGSI
jgi:hypothetical protein